MRDQFEFPHVDERNDMPSYQELEAEVERLRKRHEADEEQLCEISRFLGGRDARHVVEDGRPRTIATLAIQEIERLRAQVKLWKPMTQAEAEAAYDAAEAVPLSIDKTNEMLARILANLNDPAYRPTEPEHVRMGCEIKRLRKENTALKLIIEIMKPDGDA